MKKSVLIANVIIFLIYSFIGAIFEHLSYWTAMKSDPDAPAKALANPVITGFPLYGVGAYIVVALSKYIVKPYGLPMVAEMLLYAVVLSFIEGMTGEYVGAGGSSYKKDACGKDMVWSWDYSENKYNVFGVTDIRHAISFALIGLVIARVHPVLECRITAALRERGCA